MKSDHDQLLAAPRDRPVRDWRMRREAVVGVMPLVRDFLADGFLPLGFARA